MPTHVSVEVFDDRVFFETYDEPATLIGIKPGPRMGWILHALLDECLEDDTKNNSDYLKSQTLTLNSLSDNELKELGEKGKDKKEEVEEGELKEIRKKHKV